MRTAKIARLSALALAAAGLLLPANRLIPTGIALADNSQVAWQLSQRTFTPANGQDTVSQTFTPRSAYYLVEVALNSADPGDDAYVQLGDSSADFTLVQTGEDRFFVATHLRQGVMPALHVTPDPRHDYGGRTLTYAVAVYPALTLPGSVNGTAVSAVPNLLSFQAPRAAAYTVHYHLESGSADIVVYSNGGRKETGKVSGDGGLLVDLPAGQFTVQLGQDPGNGSMRWSLALGIAPSVRDLQPANNASLKTAPRVLSVVTSPGARLVLDHTTVGGKYDPASGRLTYRARQPLAPGLHLLEVVGADGTPASVQSSFLVLPPSSIQPPSSRAASSDGQRWELTSTPDGLYSVLKPTSWKMVGANGSVVLADPRGNAFVVLAERFLTAQIDASALAHTVESALAGRMSFTGQPMFSGNADRADFTAIATGSKGTPLRVTGLVQPSAQQYSLLLAFGFNDTRHPETVAVVQRILSSLAVHDDAGVRAARHWLRYQAPGLSLDYPDGWAANFSANNTTWIVGPADNAILYAIGIDLTGGSGGSDATAVGGQVVAYLKARLHPDLQIIAERSGDGVYRWLGSYQCADGKSQCVELGQAVLTSQRVESLWGDTSVEQLPANLPVFGRILDSAAQQSGLTPPGSVSVADAVQAMRAQIATATVTPQTATPTATPAASPQAATPAATPAVPAATAIPAPVVELVPSTTGPAPQTGSYAAGGASAYQGVGSHDDYVFMSNMLTESYVTDMNAINNIGDGNDYYYTTTDGY